MTAGCSLVSQGDYDLARVWTWLVIPLVMSPKVGYAGDAASDSERLHSVLLGDDAEEVGEGEFPISGIYYAIQAIHADSRRRNELVARKLYEATYFFPYMRDQVIVSLQSLANPSHQNVRWGRCEEGVNYYDDLTLNVHVRYDDCQRGADPGPGRP